jgi:hypothetical protein
MTYYDLTATNSFDKPHIMIQGWGLDSPGLILKFSGRILAERTEPSGSKRRISYLMRGFYRWRARTQKINIPQHPFALVL